jgi:1,4-dihydroxy-2-naphthoyl-CoA hydrolase
MTDLAALADAMPFTKLVGIELLAATADEVRARLAWSPERCTAGGVMHGAALFALADTAGALVAFLNLPEGAVGTTTISSSVNFLRGLTDGHATAVTTPLHCGRTTIVVVTDLLDEGGKLLGRVTQTQAILT